MPSLCGFFHPPTHLTALLPLSEVFFSCFALMDFLLIILLRARAVPRSLSLSGDRFPPDTW